MAIKVHIPTSSDEEISDDSFETSDSETELPKDPQRKPVFVNQPNPNITEKKPIICGIKQSVLKYSETMGGWNTQRLEPTNIRQRSRSPVDNWQRSRVAQRRFKLFEEEQNRKKLQEEMQRKKIEEQQRQKDINHDGDGGNYTFSSPDTTQNSFMGYSNCNNNNFKENNSSFNANNSSFMGNHYNNSNAFKNDSGFCTDGENEKRPGLLDGALPHELVIGGETAYALLHNTRGNELLYKFKTNPDMLTLFRQIGPPLRRPPPNWSPKKASR